MIDTFTELVHSYRTKTQMYLVIIILFSAKRTFFDHFENAKTNIMYGVWNVKRVITLTKPSTVINK